MSIFFSKKFIQTFFSVLTVGFLMFQGASFVDAQFTSTGGNNNNGGQVSTNFTPNDGDVMGFAWMGQDIDQVNTPQGGGGWLKMNCKSSDCIDSNGNGTLEQNEGWGTNILLDHGNDDGNFQGEAWSSNYGWLTYEADDVAECWDLNNNVVSPQTAKALIYDTGPEVPVIGWARFVNGLDFDDDGYDGCVSFNGLNHGVYLNLETGVITGWAWGGPVVGWISFNNPACPFCNVTVSLPNTLDIDFWADDYVVYGGSPTTLRWQAINFPPDYVESCIPSNTSNYGHWNYLSGGSAAVGPISTANGNLPSGNHQIHGIFQQTTYALNCSTRGGDQLPIKYLTINTQEGAGCTDPSATNYDPDATFNDGSCVYGDIQGCTDPTAVNYNPLATVDDGSCVGGGIPGCTDSAADNYNPLATYDDGSCDFGGGSSVNMSLDATPQIIFTDNTSVPVTLAYQASNPSNIDSGSCSGEATFNGSSINIPGWTNGVLDNPNSQVSGIDLGAWASQDGDQFVFTINCLDDDGNDVSATDTILVQDPIISSEPPVVQLFITDPDIDPAGNLLRENISPNTLSSVPLELEWNALNVNNCVASSQMYVGAVPTGANLQWNGQALADDDPNNNTDQITNIQSDLAYINNTIFSISCVAEDTGTYGTAPITANVCMGLAGVDFEQCSVVGPGNIPNYEEI